MLLSVRAIKKPRAFRTCDECGKVLRGPTIRYYGAPETGVKPYALFVHPDCIVHSGTNERIVAALKKLSTIKETT